MSDTSVGDVGRVLMICTANICRSALAAARLREILVAGPFQGTIVESAGVFGIEGAPMCEVARARLDDQQDGAHHLAREVTREQVVAADLVVTMEKAQREAVARLAPGHQGKIFTLREAAAMATAIDESEDDFPATIAALTGRMRALRGIVRPFVRPPEEPRGLRRLFARPVDDPDDGLSIPDGHNIDAESHQQTVVTVRGLVDEIGRVLRRD